MAATMSPEDFVFLRDLIAREAAIVLEAGKEYLATSRLEPVARTEGLDGVPGLVKALRANPRGKLRDQVVDAMTTNETLFFRDTHPFESLKDSLIPELINARQNTRSLDIWCGASSTGQEPYSIAMVLREHFPVLASWRVRILATDLSPSALERAKAGRYTQMEVGRGLPARYMVKYFTRAGTEWQINPDLRQMVDYKAFNLASNWPPMGPFDLIFIRNVLIYFTQETKKSIIDKASRTLAAGWLVDPRIHGVFAQHGNQSRTASAREDHLLPTQVSSTHGDTFATSLTTAHTNDGSPHAKHGPDR